MTEKKHIKTELSLINVGNVTSTRFAEKQVSGKGWVSYGNDNRFPDYLWRLYCDAPTQQSVIDAKTAFTMGQGSNYGNDVVNTKGETMDEVLQKCVFDLHLFGGFAIQVIYNAGGGVAEIYWADFSKLRTDERGTYINWCDHWNSWQVKPIRYDAFNPNMTNKTTQILYYRGTSCRSVYPVPCYISALDAIQTEVEIQHYHLNNIKNGFTTNAVINMNGGVPEEDEQKKMEELIKKKFTGSDNAGKFLISWNESKETAVTVEKIDSDNFDQKFSNLRKDTQESIFVAHRLTSGTLLGRTPTNTGFTRNEFAEAFQIFNTTVITPYQRQLAKVVKRIFPEKDLTFTPFDIQVAKNGQITREEI